MRILYYIYSLPVGGAETVVAEYLGQLRQRGAQVLLVQDYQTESFLTRSLEEQGIPMVALWPGSGESKLCLLYTSIPYGGFPHSEISGSLLICSSPKLIAAYHVLHRLLMPRHSPCALYSLTFRSFYTSQINSIDSPIGSLLVELCRLMFLEVFL